MDKWVDIQQRTGTKTISKGKQETVRESVRSVELVMYGRTYFMVEMICEKVNFYLTVKKRKRVMGSTRSRRC